MSPLPFFYQATLQAFEAYLERQFPVLPALAEALERSMKYSLFAGGKRLRPVLLLTCLESAGGKREVGLPFAAAIECIHTYSLIHDDLPCMDDDDFRRGKPTNHKVFGEPLALLAGDGLLSEAFAWASDPNLATDLAPERRLGALHQMAKKAGNFGMVAGQAVDILSEGKPGSQEVLEFIHFHKTGQLISLSVEIGGILAGLEGERLAHLVRFGEGIGKAFQIQDDILDVTGSDQELGKPVGSDEKNQKLTYPSLYGLEHSKAMAEEVLREALFALEQARVQSQSLRELAFFVLRRKS